MKKILFLLLVISPILVHADSSCDYKTFDEHSRISNDINYTITYYKESNNYYINFNNVYSGIYLTYNGNNYQGNNKNEVTISEINPGTFMKINVNSSASNCSPFIRTLNVELGYYNYFYGSSMCEEYIGYLTACTDEFLTYEINYDLLVQMINNYKNGYVEEEKKDKVEEETKVNIFENIQTFIDNYGIQIIMVLLSFLITTAIFRIKFRKIRHGI